MAEGGAAFFGTLEEADTHFTSLGYPLPQDETPTDYYLQVRSGFCALYDS